VESKNVVFIEAESRIGVTRSWRTQGEGGMWKCLLLGSKLQLVAGSSYMLVTSSVTIDDNNVLYISKNCKK
jgi:hypothetical protein